jgi:hypothetical protein
MNISFNRSFLQNSIVTKRWSSFSINDQKFFDEHRFEIEKIFNVESQNTTFEIFLINYSSFELIFKWRLLQRLKFLVQLLLYLIVDFLVFNDSELQYFFYENWHHFEENIRSCEDTNCFVYFEHFLKDFDDQFLFSFVFLHICFITFLLTWNQFMKSLSRTRIWSYNKNRLIYHQIICYWLWIKIFDWKMIDFEKNSFFKFFHTVIRIYILSHFDFQS